MSVTRSALSTRQERELQSMAILREILLGAHCSDVAQRHGMTRTAVERRAKTVATRLLQTVGVPGLRAEEAGSVRRLRHHQDALLQALLQYQPAAAPRSRRGRALSREEIERGAIRVKGRSQRRWHDLALYYLTFATGLRPLEIARLRVSDYLMPDGSERRQSQLLAEAALFGRARPLHFASAPLNDALAAYLRERVARGHGTGSSPAYRALDPDSPLFLTACGAAYPVHCTAAPDGTMRLECRSLREALRRIFQRVDIPGLGTRTARRTVMTLLHARGAETAEISEVLGIRDTRTVRHLMRARRAPLHELMERVL